MAGDLFLVFSNPTEGQEDICNEWYEHQHVPDVLYVPGVVAAVSMAAWRPRGERRR